MNVYERARHYIGKMPGAVSGDRGHVVRTPEERRAYRNAYWRQWQQRKREREAVKKARIEHSKAAPLHGKRFMRRKRWLRREPVTLAEIITKA